MQPPPARLPGTLLALARAGNLHALDQLLAHLRPTLVGMARRLVGPRVASRVELDDLFQDASIHAMRSIRTLRATDVSGFRAWFRGILHHRVLTLVHAGRPRVRPRMTMALPDDVVSYYAPDHMPDTEARASCAHEAWADVENAHRNVHGLVPDHRVSLLLHDVFGAEVTTMAFVIDRANRVAARATRLRALAHLKAGPEPLGVL